MDAAPSGGKVKRAIFRTVTAIAAVLIVLIVGLTVAVAAGNLESYRIVHTVFPDIAEGLTPVYASCEDQGIRMTVEGISIDGGSAEILLSLSGDRVTAHSDLFDSYSIRFSSDGSYGCVPLDYDEDTKTATYMIYIDQDEPIRGDKLDFSVRELLLDKTDDVYRLPEIEKDIPAVQTTKTAGTVNTRGTSLGEKYGDWDWDEWDWYEKKVKLLDPDPEQMFSPTEGVTVTAWGWVDGHLHVQALYDDIGNLDNHGYVYFKSDREIDPTFDISFWDEDHVNSYEEYVFEEVTPQDLEDVSFYGRFVTTAPDSHIYGNWHVSVILREQ